MAMSTRGILAQLQVQARMGGPLAEYARTALRNIQAAGAAGAAGGIGARVILTQIAARIGVSVGTLVLGTAVVGTILIAGGIYWATRDSGTASSGASPAGEPYGVFLVEDDVMVGQQSKIAATNACDLLGWGLECAPIGPGGASIGMVIGPFDTFEEAQAAYCESLQDETIYAPPLSSNGYRAKFGFDGAEHWMQNGPGCG
jgi:hypothetical protein